MVTKSHLALAVGLAATLVAVTAAALVPVAGASAHDYLVSSSPAADATLAEAPTSVSLTFNEALLDLGGTGTGTVVQVIGPEGSPATTGGPVTHGAVVEVPIQTSAAGAYTVLWRVVSADGHPVDGSFAFTTTVPGTTTESPPSTTPAAPTTPSTALSSPDAESTGSGAGGGVVLAIVAIVVLAALLGGLYLWYAHGREGRPRG